MRHRIIYCFRAAFRDGEPNYRTIFLSVLLIALIIAYLAALALRNGATASDQIAIPP
jgi:ABC-type polysaccharide/polyol phosphate export permease